jgi:ATP-dependent RNA helicase RhlE
MSFASLGLSAPILKAVAEQGYTTPSPIQAQAIPVVLEGKDIMAAAQTGTGKTAGFTLPLLEILSKGERAQAGQVRALVLTPTRELAAQVGESVELYGKNLPLRSAIVFGGVPIPPQITKLRRGVDILVATPGRMLDLYNQGAFKFTTLEVLVLDEADRMLDMGFIHDIRKILNILPKQRQNLMFSATFSDEIRALAKGLVKDPVEISVTPRNATATTVEQCIYPVDKSQKSALLTELVHEHQWQQVLVFSRTKHGANRLAKHLEAKHISAAAIHGNKSQGARTKALADFKSGAVRVLVATDIAARGLDIDQLPQVVNFDLPNVPEDYVHRIGRTGRAGASGHAISLVSEDEFKQLRDIERLIKQNLFRKEIAGFEPSLPLPPSTDSRSGQAARKPQADRKPQGDGRNRNRSSGDRSDRKPTEPRAGGHRDGQRSGDNARGHKPNDKNPRHTVTGADAPARDKAPSPRPHGDRPHARGQKPATARDSNGNR